MIAAFRSSPLSSVASYVAASSPIVAWHCGSCRRLSAQSASSAPAATTNVPSGSATNSTARSYWRAGNTPVHFDQGDLAPRGELVPDVILPIHRG